jgi:hypothetical protein
MLSLYLYSCGNSDIEKDEGKDLDSNVYINISGDFRFVPINNDGENLLQAEKPLTIDDFDIVLYDKDGKPYYFYNRFLRDPKNISIYGEWGGKDWVCVYLNGPENESSKIGITYLRICDMIHTVKGEWEIMTGENDLENSIGGYSIVVKKIWFDDELVFDPDVSLVLPKIVIE